MNLSKPFIYTGFYSTSLGGTLQGSTFFIDSDTGQGESSLIVVSQTLKCAIVHSVQVHVLTVQ
jgi:hypothetical protein